MTSTDSCDVPCEQPSELVHLLSDVASMANETESAAAATAATLRIVCEGCAWEIGHVVHRIDEASWRGGGLWLAPGIEEERPAIRDALDRRPLERDAFPLSAVAGGVVCATGEALAAVPLAAPLRAKTAAAVPVPAGRPPAGAGRVVAVLEFYGRQDSALSDPLTEALDGIGVQLGRVVERQRWHRLLAHVAEEERRHIGHELHDGLGQKLTAIGLLAKSLRGELAADRRIDPQAIDMLAEQARAAHRQVRRLSRGLAPVQVEEAGGLADALEQLAQEIREADGLEVRVHLPGEVDVESGLVATQLFRIAQEAVQNAVRHGDPQRVELSLRRRPDGSLRLVVEDDGCGIEAEAAARSGGMGLRAMRYRAGLLDAELEVSVRPGGGTHVACTVPPALGASPGRPAGEWAAERGESR